MSESGGPTTVVIAIGIAAGLVAAAMVLPLLVLAIQPPAGACPSPTPVAHGGAGPGGLTGEQDTNAAIIVTVTRQLGLPKRAAVIAVATAIQESGLINLDHGDAAGPDSRGLFQQRTQYYGTAVATDPAASARAFLTQLAAVPNWPTIPLADAAQAVQRSAFPALYATREPQAQTVVNAHWTGPDNPTPTGPQGPPGTALTGRSVDCGGPGGGGGAVFVLGDSITVRATTNLNTALAGRGVTVDAAVGRTLAQGLPILTTRHADIVGATVVVALCTNYGGDQPGFTALIDQTMSLLHDAAAVEWVTCTEWSPAQAAANAAIRAAHTRYPALTVAEWAAPSQTPGMLDADGVHPTIPTGIAAWTGTVIEHLPRSGPAVTGGYALPLDAHWYREHPDWFAKPHHDFPAADIPVPEGTTVYAVTAGTVISAPTGGDCGNGVIIDGDDHQRYTYCHGTHPTVPQGAHVAAGDAVMISGTTGYSTGPHLHFQINRAGGQLVCPQLALAAWASGRTIDVAALPTTGCTN